MSRWIYSPACTGIALILLLGCAAPSTERSDPVRSPDACPLPTGDEWLSLLTADAMDGWEVIRFGGEGDVEFHDDRVVLNMGEPFTGIRCTSPVPTSDYEIELEACRLLGGDFFCGLTVPVGESHCSLIIGGWGGGVLGISSLDGLDASDNETASIRAFENERWYRIRLRVTGQRVQAWLDDERVVDVSIVGRQVELRSGMIELARPLGICSWQTTAGVRDVRLRAVARSSGVMEQQSDGQVRPPGHQRL